MTFSRARSWTHSFQACSVHKTGRLSVLWVICPDFRLTVSAMEGQSTRLNVKTVSLLQGCTGNLQVCSRDNTAAVVQGCTDQGGTWLCAWALSHPKLWWVWYIDAQVTLHTADLATAQLVTSVLALARLDLCLPLPSHSSTSVLQFCYQYDFSITCSNLLSPPPPLLFFTLEKGLWLGGYSK